MCGVLCVLCVCMWRVWCVGCVCACGVVSVWAMCCVGVVCCVGCGVCGVWCCVVVWVVCCVGCGVWCCVVVWVVCCVGVVFLCCFAFFSQFSSFSFLLSLLSSFPLLSSSSPLFPSRQQTLYKTRINQHGVQLRGVIWRELHSTSFSARNVVTHVTILPSSPHPLLHQHHHLKEGTFYYRKISGEEFIFITVLN